MNSISYGVGYFLAILVVKVFSSDYYFLSGPQLLHNAQHPFNLFYIKLYDFLLMEITFKNIPSTVTAVYVIHSNYYNPTDTKPNKVKVNIENQTGQVMILGTLLYEYLLVDMESQTKTGLCTNIRIADGWDYTIHGDEYQKGSLICLAPNPCNIVVDFNNKCEANFLCNSNASKYKCTLLTGMKTTNWYKLYQKYDDIDSSIVATLGIHTKNMKFFMKLELFDNNTSVNVEPWENITNKQWSDKITLKAKDFGDYNATTQTFSETRDIQFTCEQYSKYGTNHVHIGFINTTNNKITTQNKTSLKRKFKMAENGTILCCLYYIFTTIYSYNMPEMHVNRFVKDKTLLIYQTQESISTNLTVLGSKEQTANPQTDWLIYLVPASLGICVLMMALYIIKKKHCCTNPHPVEEPVELDNCAAQNQVLYANLDFVRDENQPQIQNEESNYANIIGVIH